MNYKLFFALTIFITNSCYSGFLTPTVSKLALSYSRPALLTATSLLKQRKPTLFPLSKEEELQQLAQQLQKHDLFKNQSFKDVEAYVLSNVQNLKDQKGVIPFAQTSNFQPLFKVKEQQLAFNKLKESLDIPDEIQLYYIEDISNHAMEYRPFDRIVYTRSDIFNQNPATTLYQYIHELCHAQQHQENGLNWLALGDTTEIEHDADTKALAFIQCPLCIKAMLANYLQAPKELNQRIKSLGNFNSDDFARILQQKRLDGVCKGHQATQCPNIWSDLDTREGRKKIIADDYATGSILDRLP